MDKLRALKDKLRIKPDEKQGREGSWGKKHQSHGSTHILLAGHNRQRDNGPKTSRGIQGGFKTSRDFPLAMKDLAVLSGEYYHIAHLMRKTFNGAPCFLYTTSHISTGTG